ncbi:hypothetical protein [Lachnospira multipara]|uniref:hypothetical protein n=1 Tax=Lachnospira multipara TaxID=28051 RepID=UPI00048592E9|nr:hypothetical protein [Lachnospira multipara]
MITLNDDFKISGTTYESFAEAIKNMTDVTHVKKVRNFNIEMLSAINGDSKDNIQFFFGLGQDSIEFFEKNYMLNKKYGVDVKNFGNDLVNELINTTQLMFYLPNEREKFIVSNWSMPSLTARASITGTNSVGMHGIIRNMHLAKGLLVDKAEEYSNIVYREVDGVKKIFAVMSHYYQHIPQTLLCEIIEKIISQNKMGRMEVREWNMSHDFTNVYLEFPDLTVDFPNSKMNSKELVPGILLATSDIGVSSIIVKTTYRKGRSILIDKEINFVHKTKNDAATILERIDDEIFAEIRKLPETLISLIGKHILDYTKMDLTTEKDKFINREKITAIIDKLYSSDFKKVLKKTNYDTLKECIDNEIHSDLEYTAFDIADIFMSMPERISGVNRYVLADLQTLCGKIPYRVMPVIQSLNKLAEKITLI